MQNTSSIYKDYNHSIAAIKAFLSFCVVSNHFWSPQKFGFLPVLFLCRVRAAAVPVFLLISFYLTEKFFVDGTAAELKKRMWRLLFPYVSWAILYYFGYKLIDSILKTLGIEQGLQLEYSFRDLIWQITLGSNRFLCPQLWYLFDLIVFTVLVWSIFKIFKKFAWGIISFISVFVLYLQYSGLNYKFFSQFSYEVCDSVGRMAEGFPFVCIGFAFAYGGIAEKSKKYRWYFLFVSIIFLPVGKRKITRLG